MDDQRTDRSGGGNSPAYSAETIEEHYSSDGFLHLVVARTTDGDSAIGFDGYQWHTHGDILAELAGLSENEAIRQFVDDIIDGNQIIAISRIAGVVRDVWPTDDPVGEFKYKPPEETIEFRRWNGETVPVKPPGET